jgi:ABC-2 type transport system permease protein
MEQIFILLAPFFWSVKNDILRLSRSFYKKIFFYTVTGSFFIFLITKLLNLGMAKLQSFSAEVFQVLLVKGYSLIFLIIFFVQIINGIIISLNAYYHSKDLEILFVSPINRTSLFFSKLIETHLKASWMLVIFGLPLLISVGTLYKTNLFYYLYALLLFIAFSIITVNIGTGITIFISSFFQARKLKKVMISAGVIATVLLITLLRLFRPERFVNPELFANMTLFISELKTPSFILFPNRWLSEAIFDFLGKTINSNTVIFISLLFLTSYITTFFVQMVFRKYHYRGWELLQGEDLRSKREAYKGAMGRPISGLSRKSAAMFRSESSPLIQKELLYFIRDPKNIHQSLVIFSLVIIYLFSITALPLNWEDYAVQLKYVASFFNLGLILIIMASLCARFVYPAVVSETASLWMIKTSPVTPQRYIWTKFLFFLLPVFILGQLLTVLSSIFIGLEKGFILLNIITTSLLCLSLVSMTIFFSVSDFKQAFNNADKEQTGTGSAVYMITSVFLILLTLTLEVLPTFLYFLKASKQAEFAGKAWLIIGGGLSALFILNTIITALSLKQGIRKLQNLELP